MKRALCLGILAAMAFFFGAFGPAFAHTGVQPPPSVVGSEWKGQEDLGNFGPLTFKFQDGQKVTMIDAHNTIDGSFSQNGASVQIQFGNCVYEGTISGNVLSGTARFTSGSDAGVTWNWRVERQGR
jgi:opacity protein-like surface antigen